MKQKTPDGVDITEADADGDLTILEVPSNCVSLVTGKGGSFLRAIEDDWKVVVPTSLTGSVIESEVRLSSIQSFR